jgi:UDP-2,3-diacylglucosamine pyrophosphatase LpxH
MLYLVLSDLHLGKGRFLKNGQLNILEDFFEDDRFEEFLEFYSTGKHMLTSVTLILNGDIFNLMQIDKHGVYTHIIDDTHTVNALERIHDGHPTFFKALNKFASKANKKVVYVIGNHDSGMAFLPAQKLFNKIIKHDTHFCMTFNEYGLHVEHGHRFEMINSIAEKDYFIEGPNGRKILNLPWGSLFCIFVLPIIKKERPNIDKIRPLTAYIKWVMIHDFMFFLRLFYWVIKYLLETRSASYTNVNRNFFTSIRLLKQISIYPKYSNKARSILRRDTSLHTVVMGHTHVLEWRRYPGGKFYFNSGTWNSIPSIDIGMHDDFCKLSYVYIDIHTKSSTVREASLNTWKGKWKPFDHDVTTN